MSDLIDRQEAIDSLGEEPEVWSGKDEYEQGLNNQWHYDVNALKAIPSAHPDNRLSKIADLVDGTIDHFDLDDAMELLYQIKDVINEGVIK